MLGPFEVRVVKQFSIPRQCPERNYHTFCLNRVSEKYIWDLECWNIGGTISGRISLVCVECVCREEEEKHGGERPRRINLSSWTMHEGTGVDGWFDGMDGLMGWMV